MPNVKLEGLAELKRAFKALPEVTRDRLNDATSKTAFAILQREKSLVPVRTGALRDALDWSMSEKTGIARVGVRKGATGPDGERPGLYAHLVEFGHAGSHPAGPHPFAIPAAEAERENYLERCREAGRKVERDLSSGGGLL